LVTILIEEGEKAPYFKLDSDREKQVSLSDYQGKKVVLYFYPKDFTSGCTQEAIEFRDLAQEFKKEGIVILGVSKDSVKSHQKFKQKYDLPITLLSDPRAEVLKKYGVWKEKKLYGRTFMGTERTTFIIDENGIVEKVYRKVRPKGHPQTCLIDLTTKHQLKTRRF
jgi:peroxiredoxin Q/BCP